MRQKNSNRVIKFYERGGFIIEGRKDMRPKYEGIKFYSSNDLSIGWALKEAEGILDGFDDKKEYDVNEILELFNIQKLIESGVVLESWPSETYEMYKNTVQQFNGILGQFFGKINNDNFLDTEKKIAATYLDDFWFLFSKFKVYFKISEKIFENYLDQSDINLHVLLKYKELVMHYDQLFTKILRKSDQTLHILVAKFLEKSNINYYLPKSLSPKEFEEIFLRYIQDEDANMNVLQLIYKSQSTKECPISDKIRLEAKHTYERYWEKHSQSAVIIKSETKVILKKQDELKKWEKQGQDLEISYDIQWLEDNLDYPTVLNNFRYVFDMLDLWGRSNLVSVKSEIGVFEDIFNVNGVKFYKHGNSFDAEDMLSKSQMSLYYNFLQKHNINLEQVFKWFFEEYLPKEFNVRGFHMLASSAETTYVEKCRNLVSEMDGVLKQFRMFVQDGKIDQELFEMTSEHIVFGKIPSLIFEKYAYSASEKVESEMFALFSDQAVLAYIDKTKSKYRTLFELLKNEKVRLNDFNKYQISQLEWLISRKCLFVDDLDFIKLETSRVSILKDLYEHDVLCFYRLKDINPILKEMLLENDLKIENTLFSQPEKDYLNYELNKAEFSDGLDLRNKYAHSTYPRDELIQQNDYMQLLKIMVLVVTKINDEFCFWQEGKMEIS